jgi:hypothetical protein
MTKTITRFIGRFTGLVTYPNGTNASFGVSNDSAGNLLIDGDPNQFTQILFDIFTDMMIDGIFGPLYRLQFGGNAVTVGIPPIGFTPNPVTSYVGTITGRVTYEDNTEGDYFNNFDSETPFTVEAYQAKAYQDTIVVMDRILVQTPYYTQWQNIIDTVAGTGNITPLRNANPPL